MVNRGGIGLGWIKQGIGSKRRLTGEIKVNLGATFLNIWEFIEIKNLNFALVMEY